jgi:hypothetical protein
MVRPCSRGVLCSAINPASQPPTSLIRPPILSGSWGASPRGATRPTSSCCMSPASQCISACTWSSLWSTFTLCRRVHRRCCRRGASCVVIVWVFGLGYSVRAVWISSRSAPISRPSCAWWCVYVCCYACHARARNRCQSSLHSDILARFHLPLSYLLFLIPFPPIHRWYEHREGTLSSCLSSLFRCVSL